MDLLTSRKYIISFIIILIAIIFIIKLFFIQIIDTDYRDSADNNSMRFITQYPARGLIYDRNKEILVYNQAAYDLMLIPGQMYSFDTLELASLLKISKEDIIEKINKAKKYSYYKPTIFEKQISSQDYAILQEKLYKYHGFYVQTRTIRKYPKKIAAHIFGYVGEVNQKIIDSNPYYISGDYIGISGIEDSYENELRGKKGVKIFLVDVHNRIQGSYANGEKDTSAVVGNDLITTLDAKLQEYGESLMNNKIGSIVAIEPGTGEILSMISSPGYDPNLLVGRVRSKNFAELQNNDSIKPLFNRALMSSYPPGSTFKLINALIGLQEGVITEKTSLPCRGGYTVGSFHQGCHHGGQISFLYSIQGSCNAYYSQVFRKIIDNPKYGSVDIGFKAWYKHVKSFGLGQKLGSDFTTELKGNVPSAEYYDKIHKGWRWKSLSVVSLAIGQGELGVTPFQMANYTAIIANRGYYYIPHIVKSIEGKQKIDSKFLIKRFTTIDRKYFDPVVDGMELVVEAGTATSAKIPGISVCGKTGTAENPHGKDHSIFIAFAPKDNPKIAIAVYIENVGFGSTWAAPIAKLMIEKYLRDSISNKYAEERILNANLLN